MLKKRNQKGFTLIELVVVIAIIGILAAIAVPKFSSANESANGAKLAADLRTIDSAIVIAIANGKTVTANEDLATVTDVTANLTAVPKPPTGKFVGRNTTTAASITGTTYAITVVDGVPRATISVTASGEGATAGAKTVEEI